MPHLSAVECIKIAFVVLAVLGSLRLITLSHPNSTFSQALLLLY